MLRLCGTGGNICTGKIVISASHSARPKPPIVPPVSIDIHALEQRGNLGRAQGNRKRGG